MYNFTLEESYAQRPSKVRSARSIEGGGMVQ